MKYKLVQMVDGQMIASEFTDDNLIEAMEVRGFVQTEINWSSAHRVELRGKPIFKGLAGPMWDGPGSIRYEDWDSYQVLSR